MTSISTGALDKMTEKTNMTCADFAKSIHNTLNRRARQDGQDRLDRQGRQDTLDRQDRQHRRDRLDRLDKLNMSKN